MVHWMIWACVRPHVETSEAATSHDFIAATGNEKSRPKRDEFRNGVERSNATLLHRVNGR